MADRPPTTSQPPATTTAATAPINVAAGDPRPGTSTGLVQPAPGRHPGMPPVVTATYQQERRTEERNVATITAPVGYVPPVAANPMLNINPDELRRMGLVQVSPGVFHQIDPVTGQPIQPAPVQATLPAVQAPPRPHYVPPPRPDYAPPFMDSPVRPGFEGMPPVPQYGGKTLDCFTTSLN